MTRSQLGDYISLTTNDGQVLTFPNDAMTFVDWGSFGAPPVNWITKQGYKQHGETEVGYYLGRRTITLHLHYNHAVSRLQYWSNRAQIHDFLRHNRNGPMTLTVGYASTVPPSFFSATSFINSGATLVSAPANIVTVSSAANFVPQEFIRLNSEYMYITAVNKNTNQLTVTRPMMGSASAPHAVHTLVYYIPVGTPAIAQRSIIVRADPGMKLDKDPTREAGWYLDEDMNFLALNPIWFDPTVTTQAISAAASQSLVFPITFPITFSVAGFQFTAIIPYTGTWYAYPTVTLTGPYQSVLVQNISTGVSFSLVVPLAAGQQRLISTTPGSITVLDQNGQDHFNELGTASDLVDFNLRPAPEVANGQNSIQVSMYNPNLALGSAAAISYNTQYIGI